MMKKILVSIFVLLTIIASILTFTVKNEKISNYEKNASIDKSQDVMLDFSGYSVKVIKWNKDEVKVKSNLRYGNERNFKIFASGNNISAKTINGSKNNTVLVCSWTWLPLMQFKEYWDQFNNLDTIEYDFVVYVPGNTAVKINGKYIRTDGCTVSYVEGGEAVLRDSTLSKSFKEKVSSLTVRDCKIPKNIVFEKKPGDIRDNKRIN